MKKEQVKDAHKLIDKKVPQRKQLAAGLKRQATSLGKAKKEK